MKRQIPFLGLALICLALAALACGIFGDEAEDENVSALSESLNQTTTARAAAPAATEAVDTQATVESIRATATQQIVAATVTREVAITEVAVEEAATAEAEAPIKAELVNYGIDPNQGRLGWVQQPLVVQSEGYLQYGYGGDFLGTVARDFVLAADITWNTRFGTTGCGYVLRSDGNEEAFNQYLVIATRGAAGHVGFVIMVDGEVLDDEITDIFASGIDPLFEWQNDTTNRIVVIGRGNTFSIYSNGTFLGDVTPSVAYDRGFIAFVALNESGDTTCQFTNAWLWLLG